MRDFNSYSHQKTPLEKLLNKSFCLQATASILPGEIVADLFKYLRVVGEFAEAIQNQILAEKGKQSLDAPIPFRTAFEQLCKNHTNTTFRFERKPEGRSPLASESLNKLSKHLIALQATMGESESGIGYHLENVLSNLIPHLDIEMQYNQTIEPIETHLHLNNVLFLTQIIAEEVLVDILSLQGLTFGLEDNEHDLWLMVQKLGMKREHFHLEEYEFLTAGKATRQVVRYPGLHRSKMNKGHHSRVNKIKELLYSAYQMSVKQSAATDMRHFIQADKAASQKLKAVKMFTVQDISILANVIIKVLTHSKTLSVDQS